MQSVHRKQASLCNHDTGKYGFGSPSCHRFIGAPFQHAYMREGTPQMAAIWSTRSKRSSALRFVLAFSAEQEIGGWLPSLSQLPSLLQLPSLALSKASFKTPGIK